MGYFNPSIAKPNVCCHCLVTTSGMKRATLEVHVSAAFGGTIFYWLIGGVLRVFIRLEINRYRFGWVLRLPKRLVLLPVAVHLRCPIFGRSIDQEVNEWPASCKARALTSFGHFWCVFALVTLFLRCSSTLWSTSTQRATSTRTSRREIFCGDLVMRFVFFWCHSTQAKQNPMGDAWATCEPFASDD